MSSRWACSARESARNSRLADERDDADRHVDQEDRLPGQPERMRRDQDAAQDLAADIGKAERRAVESQRAALFGGRKQHADRGQHLRRHHGGGRGLAGSVRRPARWVTTRSRTSTGPAMEAGNADQEHAAPSSQIAEPAAGDQEHRISRGDRPKSRTAPRSSVAPRFVANGRQCQSSAR